MTPNQITGKLIREARKRAGLTQSQLAGLIGCSRTAITRWERGERWITADTISRLATALDVRQSDLVSGLTSIVKK